jgi:hypothetical protein
MLRISGQVAGEAEAAHVRFAFDPRNQCHQPGVNGVEIKEQQDTARYRRVPVCKAELRQPKDTGLLQSGRRAQSLAGNVDQRSLQVQRFLGITLFDELLVTGEFFQEVIERLFVIRGVLELLLENAKVVGQVLRCCVHNKSLIRWRSKAPEYGTLQTLCE